MNDAPTGTTPVRDHRPTPTGPISRRTQTWFMVGFSLLILLVIMFAGRPAPPPAVPRAASEPVAGMTAERLREYQQRLRAQEPQGSLPPPPLPEPPTNAVPMDGATAPPPPDPLEAERARREYESLFANTLVYTRRPPGEVGQWTPPLNRNGIPPGPVTDAANGPNLDAVAEAVLRATAKQQGPAAASPTVAPAAPAPGTPDADRRSDVQSTPPISPAGPRHRLLEGTVVEATLANRLDGARPGPVICTVSTAVYSHAGHTVLIPAGARFLGRTRPVDRLGQNRLEVTFHRLIWPDGRSEPLDDFVALNQRGDVGLRDRVNHHYASTFGAAAAVGVITGVAQALGNAGIGSATDRTVIIGGGADATAQATGSVLNRLSSRLPEVTIREGHRIRIYVTTDLDLPAYESVPRAAAIPETK